MATLSQKIVEASCLSHVKQLRKETVQGVEYISTPIDYQEFFLRFLVCNRPCVFGPHITQEWRCIQDWVLKDGKPNVDFLIQNFGDATVPVADCELVEHSAQPKSDMKLSEYLQTWQTVNKDVHDPHSKCLYLKDWHFTRLFPDYEAYNTPVFFTSDWMNEYWDVKPGQTSDDYRFVYIGPKGSWTPFHADVFQSYSWSANICGRKKWLLFPPGQEVYLRDTLGNVVYDVTSAELHDDKKYPDYHHVDQVFEVIQEQGEVIFIPSGWYHQVHNIEDTISINHNWLNGCNVDLTWSFLQHELASVKASISDCINMEGWDSQCQIIMKANTGIDYVEFLQLLWTVAVPRLHQLQLLGKECSDNLHNSKPTEPEEAGEMMHHPTEVHGYMIKCEHYGRTVQGLHGTNTQELCIVADCTSSVKNVAALHHSEPITREKTLHEESSAHEETMVDINSVNFTENVLQCDSNIPKCTGACSHDNVKSFMPLDSGFEQACKWHSLFDLYRIKEVVKLMMKDEDFCKIDSDSLCKNPQQLIKEIVSTANDLV